MKMTALSTSIFAGLLCWLTMAGPAQAQNLSKAEQIYADLATLVPAERQKRIEDGARAEGHVAILQTMRGDQGDGQMRLFQQRYPYLKVDWSSSLGSQDGADRLYSEEAAGRHLTDVVHLAIGDLTQLMASNMVARYPTPAAQRILPQYRRVMDPENRFTPSFWDVNGMVYNTSLVPPDRVPKQWQDLCDPFFKGNISFDPVVPREVAGFAAMFGDKTLDFFKCLGANKPIIQRGYSQRFLLMVAGDHMVVSDAYVYQVIEEKNKNANAPVAMVTTAPFLASFAAGIINRNTEHPYASALFIDWLLSDESQNYLVQKLRGPVAVKHPFLPDDAAFVVMPTLPKEQSDPLVAEWRHYVEGTP